MRLTAGLITYNDGFYAVRCLDTLTKQTGLGELGKDWQIVVHDNASTDAAFLDEIEEKFPQVTLVRGNKNLGFGKGHNLIMKEYPVDFHAVLNVDIIFAEDFLSHLLQALEEQHTCGSATGKLRYWDYDAENEKTNLFDSTGIVASKAHAFWDRGQGKKDTGQYDQESQVFGGTGAATLYRRSGLDQIAYNEGEYFDETMFMYKEDIDLAYRLVTIGAPCLYVPSAVAWHHRTASSILPRHKRPKWERVYSAAHQTLIINKHMDWLPKPVRKAVKKRNRMRWLYLLLREPITYCKARTLLKNIGPEAKAKVGRTKHTVSFADVSYLFS